MSPALVVVSGLMLTKTSAIHSKPSRCFSATTQAILFRLSIESNQ